MRWKRRELWRQQKKTMTDAQLATTKDQNQAPFLFNELPLHVQVQILRWTLVFDGKVVHAISRFGPYYVSKQVLSAASFPRRAKICLSDVCDKTAGLARTTPRLQALELPRIVSLLRRKQLCLLLHRRIGSLCGGNKCKTAVRPAR